MKNMISTNSKNLRKRNNYTQEQVIIVGEDERGLAIVPQQYMQAFLSDEEGNK